MTSLTSPATSAEVDELLAAAAQAEPDQRPVLIAGGTDLLVQRRAGRQIVAVIDLTNLTDAPPPVQELPGGLLRLSATASITEIAADLGTRLPALAQAIAVFGSPQIRNRATIGGNLGTASPSGDLMPPLLTAGGSVRLRGAAGRRQLPMEDFLVGPRRTALQPGEWIESVEIDTYCSGSGGGDKPGVRSGFRKIGGRRALAISVVNLAWRWSLDGDGHLADVRLAVGAAAPTVIRARRAESLLEGAEPAPDVARHAAAQLAADLAPIDDLRGSAEYRRAAAAGLLTEALLPLLSGAGITTR